MIKVKDLMTDSILPAILFGSSIVLIALAIHINPSGMPPHTPFDSFSTFYIFIIPVFILSTVIYLLPLMWLSKKHYFPIFFCSFSLQLAIALLYSLNLHRDFFTLVFQLFLIFPLIFFLRYRKIYKGPQETMVMRRLYMISMLFFTLWFLWLMMMGYAIATRQEPRWNESILYNVYNAVLVLLLFVQMLKIRLNLYRKVIITEKTIRIDSHDFTKYLGEKNLNIVQTLIDSPGERVNCALIYLNMQKAGMAGSHDYYTDCKICMEHNDKVTLCPQYKSIYNRILEIKKLFESLEIGTIISPDNKMNILSEGWKLRFFDDVQVITQKINVPGKPYSQTRPKVSAR